MGNRNPEKRNKQLGGKMKRWEHQERAFQFLKERQCGALFMDMGTGKTKVMIDIISQLPCQEVLIVCPKSVCEVWIKQLEIHMELPYFALDLSKIPGNRKREALNLFYKPETGIRVAIINYDSIWREPLKGYLLKSPPEVVICDESHRIKSSSSAVSRFMTNLGKRVKYKYCLTGTPLPQSPLDVYGQYRFMAPEIFGTNFGKFSHRYAIITNTWGYDEIKGYQNLDELTTKMYSIAFRVKLSDVMELPETQDIQLDYELSYKAQRCYSELRREGCLEFSEGVLTTGTAIALIGRLQQICSGYAPVYDDNGVETIVEIDDGRIKVLEDWLDGIDILEPVVVFCKYRKDIRNVLELGKKLGRTVYELSGRINQYREFKEHPDGIIVVQIQAGSSGIDLTEARYCVYYSHSYSLSDYEQSRARVHRPGQKRPVIYYSIVAKHKRCVTIDEQIIKALQTKQDLVDVVMKDLSHLP